MDKANKQPFHLPSDAVWFITGCSSGIGQSLARLVAKTQNRVVATARNPSTLADIPDGPNVLKLALDVTSTPSIEAALSDALLRFGRVDVVVNNAGYGLEGDTEGAGDDESHALMDTNFWGMVDITKRALGIMRDENPKSGSRQRGGVVLNVSSVGGFLGFPAGAFYHASKFAMEGWSEAVAKELPADWNIHLCNIEPGGVKTNYATTSMKHMSKRHPAYADPRYPTNLQISYREKPENRESWVEPDAVAAAMHLIVSRGRRIPIRLPLGPDSFGLISQEIDNVKRDLEEHKEISLSVFNPQKTSSAVEFLRKHGAM
ncbi:NAD(P)-binding protein [Xylariaceae sp. FL0804]|nr:NAD(P)-binding protein [Xylariaceae sp. FL0804]